MIEAGSANRPHLIARPIVVAGRSADIAPALGAFTAIGRRLARLHPVGVTHERARSLAASPDQQHEQHSPKTEARSPHITLAFHHLTRIIRLMPGSKK